MDMKLSIITINRNNAAGLRKTMESVFSQTYRDFEYIVVDGASTDGSVDIIREYESVHSLNVQSFNFIWISEPDTGIYNAMNKGIEIASGLRFVNALNRSERSGDKNKEINRSELVEDKNKGIGNKVTEEGYVLMLNSGDYLVDEHVIERIIPELDGTDIIQGNVIEDYPNKTIRFRGYGKSDISFIDVMDANFPHQAMFIKLSIMEKYGYYDDSYMQDPRWIKIDKEEDARWYGEHISRRLWDLYKSAPKKIRLYDQLHKNKLIWKLAMGLVRISEWLSPTSPEVKIERIQ